MRSRRWQTPVQAISRYELRDAAGRVLGSAATHSEGARMLEALVVTSPDWEHDVRLVSLDRDGTEVMHEDFLDIELIALFG